MECVLSGDSVRLLRFAFCFLLSGLVKTSRAKELGDEVFDMAATGPARASLLIFYVLPSFIGLRTKGRSEQNDF